MFCISRIAFRYSCAVGMCPNFAEIAATYRAGKFKNDNGYIFSDDFPEEQLEIVIEKNNLDDTKHHQYPIKNKG